MALPLMTAAEPLAAVAPGSPEVRKLVDRAVGYLDSARDDRLGGKCLVALALLKTGHPAEHSQVLQAVEACHAAARRGAGSIQEDIYSSAIALIFLCELDPSAETNPRGLAGTFLDSLVRRQKEHGGWGYPNVMTGDTSMTQYGVLSTWTAYRAGLKVAPESIVRVCNWLMRTQDPSGSWGYQGVDPGDFRLVEQNSVSLSLSTAGLGSMLVCADLLGLAAVDPPAGTSSLPAALRPVDAPRPALRQWAGTIDRKVFRAAVERGNRWFSSNYRIQPPLWIHYYLYALERYMSFRELIEGRAVEQPQWYQDGYRMLAETQAADGSWATKDALTGPAVDTAFSVLFLIRSTRQSIQQSYGEGVLVGGRGLPSRTGDIRLRRGRIVSARAYEDANQLIEALSNPDHADHLYLVENPDELVREANLAVLKKHVDRLELVLTTGSPDARLLAVRGLSAVRDLDHVPWLIRALGDADWRVVLAADEGLRFISRRFDGFGIGFTPDEVVRKRSIDGWRDWYQTIRPAAIMVR
jgi:hypothetical protein